MGLPGTNPTRINEFHDKMVTNIQTLQSMGKEKDIRGYVRLTLDKLPGIRADLVRLDDNWQEWGFPQLVEGLRKWCERNPVPLDGNHGRRDKGRDPLLQAKQEGGKHRVCVFCKSEEHKSDDCDKIEGVVDKRRYLSDNKLALGIHRAVPECRFTRLLARGVKGSTID